MNDATAIILAAFIGASGTILAAVLTKTYVDVGAKNVKDVASPNPLRKTLLDWFLFFQVSNRLIFKVKNHNEAFVDKQTGLMIVPESRGSRYIDSFGYQLPHQDVLHSNIRPQLGWRKLLEWDGHMYSLSLVKIESSYGRIIELSFDFRLVRNNLKRFPVHSDR